jgi:hypothetical protein
MKNSWSILQAAVLNGSDMAEGLLRTAVPGYPEDRNPLGTLEEAGLFVEHMGYQWSRGALGMLTVYGGWHTGVRKVLHPLVEVIPDETMPPPLALIMSALRAAELTQPLKD